MTFAARALAHLTPDQLTELRKRLSERRRPGRRWSCTLGRRITITCAALRTNLTMRELAAVFQISKSTVHRIVSRVTAQLARLNATATPKPDRRSVLGCRRYVDSDP